MQTEPSISSRRENMRVRRRSLQPLGAFPWLVIGTSALVLLWTYWHTVVNLFHDWRTDDNYSVGLLVPLAAAYLLWQDRAALRNCPCQPFWPGLFLLALAQVLHIGGLLFLFESAERYALILTIAALVLTLGGRGLFRQTFWLLLFLVLMVPLPGKLHNLISGPLQNLATAGAVFTLEIAGVGVAREGNVILLNDSVPIAVAEACSGLRMLTAFIVVAATLAYLVHRPRWQKTVLVLSSVPVAILCNLARLFATAELFLHADSRTAEKFFHDFAGLAMMPLAVLLLVLELILMNKLLLPPPPEQGSRQATIDTLDRPG